MKKLFVFEIDNVLANLDEGLFELAKNKFGKLSGIEKDDMFNFLFETMKNPNIYYGFKPIKPMLDLILDLQASGYPVGVFTTRPETALGFTKKWLKKQLMADLAFVHCVTDKSDFLYDIRKSLQFIVDSDLSSIYALKADGFPVLAYLDYSNYEVEIHPCLYGRVDGTIMLWQKADEESVPLFEYLNGLDE